jgi:phosphoesterase RecJ-like protein
MDFSIFKKVEEFETIIIHRHERPDGDALGSQIGFKEAIKATYPSKRVFVVGDENVKYNFIGEMDIIDDEEYKDSLVFVLDTPEEKMISDERYKLGKCLIKVDHHVPRTNFGDFQIVDPSYESLAGLIADVVFETNMELTDFGARALFCGIVTDSGRFRYDSVTSRTFEISAKLLRYNFSISDVYNSLYLEDLKMVKLRAKFIMNFKLTRNNVAYTKTTSLDLMDYEASFYTISRGMVNTMGGIKGIDIWVNFTEDNINNVVIAEIRSNKYNINEIATKYGGGGHKGASGATLSSFEEADSMLYDLDELIKDNG